MAITRKANPVSAIDVLGRFQPLATIWKMLVLGAFNPLRPNSACTAGSAKATPPNTKRPASK
jgi:hypothetical protein